MNREEFVLEVEKLGISVNEEKIFKLEKFYNLLIDWNNKINLTTIVEKKSVYLKHFYDSLTLYKEVNLDSNIKLCDVGSGAGFPGIVLKIFFPNLDVVLIDSLNKRVNYLNEIIKELNLSNIIAIHSRMEDFSKLHEEEFDIITARAVSNLNILAEISVKALKINGRLVFMKANCEEEISNLSHIYDKLCLSLVSVNRFLLPVENSNRTLISLVKNKKTNVKYPRTIDKIKRNPL